MKRNIFRLLLSAVLMMCCTMMANASNPDATKIGNIYYILDDANKTAEVTYTGESTDDKNEYTGSITIPSTVSYMSQDYSVTSIGNYAFFKCSTLSFVTIPSSVTNIGELAFNSCTGLTSIIIPSGVTSIGNSAFYNCSGLTSIIIPGSVANIGADAFGKCTSLTLVTIPEGVTSIGEGAFYYCSSLTSITIPKSVMSIGSEAFDGCSSLKSLTIPSGITNIETKTFSYCSGLTYLVVLATNPPSVGFQAFWDVNVNSIPVYVPNVNVYQNKSWGGFTNFKGYDEYINVVITEIEEAKNGVKLTDADQESISRYIDQINNANDLAAVASAKSVAMAIINLQKAKDATNAEIDNAMNGLTTLTEAERQSINSYKTAINEATTEEVIINNKLAAMAIINLRAAKDAAIAEIDNAMNGLTTLTEADRQSINSYKTAINEATTEEGIINNKLAALAIINLQKAKDAAITEIDNAMNGLTTLTEADRQSINSYKTAINEATTEEVIINNKLAALAIINLQKAKDAAIAEIQKEMQGETGSAYLNGLVEDLINAINAATDENIINSNKESAISKIKEVIDIYKEIKSAEFGEFAEMRTPRPGTAVKVTKGEKEVILYAPDKVEYFIRK